MKLGVYGYYTGGLVGIIQMTDNQITASSAVQDIVDSQLNKANGQAHQAFQALKNWSNGYLWVKPMKDEKTDPKSQ